jgi:hypothetical protein
MIKDKETKCGVYTANENNPLGLFRQGNQYYQLLGFFNYNDDREFRCDMRGDLPFSRLANSLRWGFNVASIYPDDQYSNEPHENTVVQIRHLQLDPTEVVYVHANFNICYLFQIYRSSISFNKKVAHIKEQAICDYLHHNEIIPQIMTVNRLAKEISIYSAGDSTYSDKTHEIVDKKLFTESIDPENTYENLKYKSHLKYIMERYDPESIIARQTEAEKSEISFTLMSDYAEESKRLNVDLLSLHQSIKKQAYKKGGFVVFEYKNKKYDIPLIPLIAWKLTMNSLTNKGPLNKFKLNNDTWYTQSTVSIKTDNDNPFHTDWWIGAGFPLETYSDTITYRAFNAALLNFSFEFVGKNTLDDIQFLAGQDLPAITGNIVKHPSSIDDFNEDDIIILPDGGVEFDSYIKKACKNNKGAVILEIGNKVAHLTIVSRELNSKGFGYRLILLPDADKLLKDGTTVKIDSINNKIVPL